MPTKKFKAKKQKLSARKLQSTLVLSTNAHSFHDFVSAIDWKESYVSLSLGVLVVAVVISMVLLFAKGKSMNIISFNHPTKAISSAKTVNKNAILAMKSYTVQDGDNLAVIAASYYGTEDDWTKIAQANKLDDPDIITPGQVLQIPR